MPIDPRLHTRRDVLAGAAALAAGRALPAFAAPPRRLDANSKANIAFIGIGNYGAQNLNELASQNVVAVCDVDWRTREQNPGRFTYASEVAAKHPEAKRFDDWRVMLDQMDREIDAVVVCTADHVHAQAALTAMARGKHTYCEKPLAATVAEVRAMQASARRRPAQATQTGIVGHASEDVRRIVEYLQNGAIGTVERMDIFQTNWAAGARYASPYPEIGHIHDATPTPAEVKWDLFLGPAPERPFEPMYIPLRWRNWQDFGTGILGDHGPHFLDPVVWALDLDWPDTLVGDADETYTTDVQKQMFPRTSHVTYSFPAKGSRPAVSLKWWGYDTPPLPPGWPKDQPLPTGGGIVYGSKGVMVYGPVYSSKPGAFKQVYLFPEELSKTYKPPAPTLPRPTSHWMEWIEAARDGKQPSCNWQYGGHITELCLLGNIAIELRGTTLRFDGRTKTFSNSEAANALFSRPRRKGWALPT